MQENENVEIEKDQVENIVNTDETTVSQENEAPVADETPISEVEKLQIELAEQKDKYLRLMAEFENYKRRTSKERIDLIQSAGKDILVSLLDVLDDVDRAEKQLNANDDMATQKEGIQLVFNKIRSTVFSKGVKPMESVQQEFDVEKHEAITEIPAPSEELVGKVIDEVQKGYTLNDKIIRFAKVVVGK
ncbi:MAG: nucleotide exchange factor GrpE [Chitinophagaceae bacterium]|nr:nucleotide exchange factor GrpE [Chitinophagaceae bacterium]